MRKWTLLLVLTLFPYLAGSGIVASAEAADPPKRINKAIELLERGQPIYYAGAHGGYEEGRKMAQTWADYINYEMEHGSYDVTLLRKFMQGLADGGPTASGHRTPAVICTLPVGGIDEATMKANYWMVQQVLATGVHGILLCHARTPGAVQVLVQAARYPFHRQGVGTGLERRTAGQRRPGLRQPDLGGLTWNRYLELADPWPLNPQGEILLGLKVEDRHALINAEASVQVPGVGFAEWGPSDMGFSLRSTKLPGEELSTLMRTARQRVFSACKAAGVAFLNGVRADNGGSHDRRGGHDRVRGPARPPRRAASTPSGRCRGEFQDSRVS